jgi:hypothetical protein
MLASSSNTHFATSQGEKTVQPATEQKMCKNALASATVLRDLHASLEKGGRIKRATLEEILLFAFSLTGGGAKLCVFLVRRLGKDLL